MNELQSSGPMLDGGSEVNMSATIGLYESQVQYWESEKWVAKLRVNKTDDNLLLLHTNMEVSWSWWC